MDMIESAPPKDEHTDRKGKGTKHGSVKTGFGPWDPPSRLTRVIEELVLEWGRGERYERSHCHGDERER